MGFDEGRMVLDSPNGTYYSGQTIHGKLIFQQDKVKSFRGLFVKLKGFCQVHWTTTHTRTVDGKSETYTVNHNAYEEYVNRRMYLVGGVSGEVTIQPGKHEYAFQFHLPVNCPPSFEGEYGHIRYAVKAVVDRAFKFDQEKKVAVRVMVPLDLNLYPFCKEPINLEFQEIYDCCCMSSGAADVSVKLPLAGYCPGQTIPIEVVCSNKGNLQIDDIRLCITRMVVFIATSEPGLRKVKETVVEIKKGPIPGNTNRNWTVEMEVPAMDVYNLLQCEYIKLECKFKVVVNPDGCHSDSKESRRILIGTVPLVGFQDNVQNPLHDQFPQPTAITEQPESSYPPQPPENTSFPYHDYPQGNQPNAPYPPTSSSYPAANPPYPNVTPYLDNPPPYPGNLTNPATNFPYSGANPPYPNEKQPYTGANPPNTGANVPYGTKASGMPSPGNVSGLRTGNLGFTASSGGSGMNLPPPLPHNNPGSPRAPSPFAAASAPTLDSPTTALLEKKD